MEMERVRPLRLSPPVGRPLARCCPHAVRLVLFSISWFSTFSATGFGIEAKAEAVEEAEEIYRPPCLPTYLRIYLTGRRPAIDISPSQHGLHASAPMRYDTTICLRRYGL